LVILFYFILFYFILFYLMSLVILFYFIFITMSNLPNDISRDCNYQILSNNFSDIMNNKLKNS
jgi:hypothetical protein